MLVKPFQVPENKISLPNLVHSSGRIVFPMALQDGVRNTGISAVDTPPFLRKAHCKSYHIWDHCQPLSSMVPIIALHRKVLQASTQSSPFSKLSLALSLDVGSNDIVYFLKCITLNLKT